MRTTAIACVMSLTVAIAACQNDARRATTTTSEDQSEATSLIDEAATVARQMKTNPDVQRALTQAKGVFIIPDYGKGGLGVGAAGGAGVVLAHDGTRWSAPVFYDIGTVSVGAQAGGKAGKMAMLLMTDKALDSFRRDTDFSLNASAGLTIVDWDAFARATTAGNGANAPNRPDVVVWSDTAGAFAGATVGITGISPDDDHNQAYYSRTVDAQDVFTGKVAGPANGPIRSALG